jgi:hypothetical protein
MDCAVCFEKKVLVSCEHCGVAACQSCWCKFFVVSDIKCLNCGLMPTDDFLYANFPLKFINKTLVGCQQNKLLEYYKSHIVETSRLLSDYNILKYKYLFCKLCLIVVYNGGWLPVPHTGLFPIYKPFCPGCDKKLVQLPLVFRERLFTYYFEKTYRNIPKISSYYSCSRSECYGCIVEGKCNICLTNYCESCLEIIETNHICKDDVVKSVRVIEKDVKRCPSCATPILRSSGCSQMWCTQCNTPFDYNTGIITTRRIDNPHYTEHIQCQKNLKLCPKGKELFKKIRYIKRLLIPHEKTKLISSENITIQTIRLILKEINEDRWKAYIKRSVQKNRRQNSIIKIYDTFVTIASTCLSKGANHDDILDLYRFIDNYSHLELGKIGSKALLHY